MNKYLICLINFIDGFTEKVGKLTAWLVLMMVLLISYDVAMRYFFHQGSVALQELEWHLFALLFLLGAAYTLKHDEHVRVDVLSHSSFVSENMRLWINILGTLIFLVPFCILIVTTTWPFVSNAYLYHEGSPDPGGLPHRFILKGAIVFAFAHLLLQGISELLKNILKLKARAH